MGKIVLLDDNTINKIAAGEVVDRQSSIVKELVENSIDAKATSITVEIKKGGINYIKITDNGVGFASDDVELAFERHATSKIRKEEDLLHITSMGFRGEALASIAAISKVTLVSKSKDEDIGVIAQVEAGEVKSIQQTASTTGTKIEIRDVFFNVPARYKFLKKDYTEAGYIEDVVIRIALANPGISLKYINNGKTIVQTSGNGNLRSTIYDIFGKDIYENLIDIDYELNEMSVKGVIGLPKVSRSTRMHQFMFINSRYIKDKTMMSAIDRACEQKYAINKFPFIVLNLSINPMHIDVNVHPAKLEVKFDDEQKIFDVIYFAVRSAIEKNNKETSPFTTIKAVENVDKIDEISKDLLNNGIIKNENSQAKNEKKFDFDNAVAVQNSKNSIVGHLNENNSEYNYNSNLESIPELKIEDENLSNLANDNNIVINSSYSVESEKNCNVIKNESSNLENNQVIENSHVIDLGENENLLDNNYTNVDVLEKESKPYKYIGNVFDTYIIIQIAEKMYIIDQHAAHERLLYEQIKEAYYSKDRQSQLLLIPILVELTTKEKETVINNFDMFEKSGFILEDFDDKTIKITGIPNIGYNIEYKSMFKDLIDDIMGATKTEKSEKEFRFIATLACKAAVKGKMKLTVEEQISLIDDMVKLDNPFTCPHGRPTAYEISKYEIERRFLRK